MSEILSQEEFKRQLGPGAIIWIEPGIEPGYEKWLQVAATIEALAEALRGELGNDEAFCTDPSCAQCARVNSLRKKGWLVEARRNRYCGFDGFDELPDVLSADEEG